MSWLMDPFLLLYHKTISNFNICNIIVILILYKGTESDSFLDTKIWKVVSPELKEKQN